MAEEAAAALDATDKDVPIGGAGLARKIELGLVDELRMFHNPIVVVAARSSYRRSPKTFG